MKQETHKPCRIMVADNDANSGRALKAWLETFGYEVTVCTDGFSALAMINLESSRSPFNLILLDLDTPGVNGMELLREVRRPDQGIPVIIMSPTASAEEFWEGIRSGADDYLQKPIDQEQLRLKCQLALES